jgi:hypothetical protein
MTSPSRLPSPAQVDHLLRLNSKFIQCNTPKYVKGAKEHQGNLWEMTPLQFAENLRDEAIDAFNYAQSLIDKLEAQ